MACDCESEVEGRLLESLKQKYPESQNGTISLDGYGIGISESMNFITIAFMGISYSADFPLKRGGVKRKSIKSRLTFNFCPFCGKRYEDKQPKEKHAPLGVEHDENWRD